MSPTEASPIEMDFSPPDSPTPSLLQIVHRPRRLRRTEILRRMVRETILRVEDLIYPLFVMEGEKQRQAVASMPGCYRYTIDLLLDEVKQAYQLGIGAIALFPLIPSHQKDNAGTESYNPNGLIPRAVRAIKEAVSGMVVIGGSGNGQTGVGLSGYYLPNQTAYQSTCCCLQRQWRIRHD